MTDFPNITGNDFNEREAIHAVGLKLSKMKLVWRETTNTDIGIDGQIEHCDDRGKSTGLLVAAQVKGGVSFFANESDESIPYYPSEAHRNYWGSFPIPVILILYHPERDEAFWIDVRNQLTSPARGLASRTIHVPKANTLSTEYRDQIFASFGPRSQVLAFDGLLEKMIRCRNRNLGFSISYFGLFFGGLTDISRKLYFSMDLAMELAEAELAQGNHDFGIGIGDSDYSFLDSYFDFVAAQRLAHVDYADLILDKEVRQMTPSAIWPLTKRAQEFLDYVQAMQPSVLKYIESEWEDLSQAAYSRIQTIKEGNEKIMTLLQSEGVGRNRQLFCTMESYVRIWANHKFASLSAFERGYLKMRADQTEGSAGGV